MSELLVQTFSEQGVRDNEDTYVVDESSGLFAVFDGASSLVPYRSPDGKTGARVAAEISRDIFAASPQEDLVTLALQCNQAIEAKHLELGIDVSTKRGRFSCTVAAVQIHGDVAYLLQNADSLIVAKLRDGSITLPIGYHDADLPIMKKWRQFADEGRSDIRKLVDTDILALRERSNADEGHGVLNGDPDAAHFLKTATLPLADITALLILTDGMFLPKEDPESEEDWKTCFELCESGGLMHLYNTVRDLENTDPNLTRYPRYKLHDDATGIYITMPDPR